MVSGVQGERLALEHAEFCQSLGIRHTVFTLQNHSRKLILRLVRRTGIAVKMRTDMTFGRNLADFYEMVENFLIFYRIEVKVNHFFSKAKRRRILNFKVKDFFTRSGHFRLVFSMSFSTIPLQFRSIDFTKRKWTF